MSRKKKTYHYAITSGCGVCGGVDILGITDSETIARKYCENYNRINDSHLSVEKFQDFKELGDVYLSKERTENDFYLYTRNIQINPNGKIEIGYCGSKVSFEAYMLDVKWRKKPGKISTVRHSINHYIEGFTMIRSWIYLWAPNEEAARAAAYKSFEENQFEVLKEYHENSSKQ